MLGPNHKSLVPDLRPADFLTPANVISAHHHLRCEFESHPWRGVLDTTLCDKTCQWLVTGRWFSPGTPVSSNNKTNDHDITEILLKVALNIITPYPNNYIYYQATCMIQTYYIYLWYVLLQMDFSSHLILHVSPFDKSLILTTKFLSRKQCVAARQIEFLSPSSYKRGKIGPLQSQ